MWPINHSFPVCCQTVQILTIFILESFENSEHADEMSHKVVFYQGLTVC